MVLMVAERWTLSVSLDVKWQQHMTNECSYGNVPNISDKIRLRLSGYCAEHPEVESGCVRSASWSGNKWWRLCHTLTARSMMLAWNMSRSWIWQWRTEKCWILTLFLFSDRSLSELPSQQKCRSYICPGGPMATQKVITECINLPNYKQDVTQRQFLMSSSAILISEFFI